MEPVHGVSRRGPSLVVGLILSLSPGGGRPTRSDLYVYETDAEDSSFYVVTHKRGLMAFLGHEHAIVPRDWTAELCLGEPLPRGSHGMLVLRTSSLVIDSDSARALAGLGGGPGPKDVVEIQKKLLDRTHLAAEAYPEIRLDLAALDPETRGRIRARGTISIRGFTREMEIPVSVERDPEHRVTLSGWVMIRQSDFGIEPESIVGVVKDSDGVDLHFVVAGRPTTRACPAA